MSKEIYISSTPHETRLAIVEDEALAEIYYERENEYTLAGSIYNGRVTRVLPGMQSSFVDIGLDRDAFLYITDFLEEAPDSEEFDTAPAGDRAPRPAGDNGTARSDSARSDSSRGDSSRGDRDRGGRGRRGGRDRNRDRGPDRSADRTPSDRTPSEAEPIDAPFIEAEPLEPGFDRGFAPGDERAGEPSGEAAPASEGTAEGGRRWRGRRGRRRGRGSVARPGEPGQQDAAPGESAPQTGGEDDFAPELDQDSDQEFEASADSAAPPAAPFANDNANTNAPRADSGNRDRNRRDDGRNRPRRDGRGFEPRRRDDGRNQGTDQRHDQENDQRPAQDSGPRAPRGFEPRRERYGAGGDERAGTGPIENAYDAPPAGEPIILPGELLSKYRRGEEPAASASATSTPANAIPVTLAPPASLYTVAAGWDGGDVLPGETLRRRPSESRPEGRSEPRSETRSGSSRDSGGRDRNDRTPRRDREPRRDSRDDDRRHSTQRSDPSAAEIPHDAPAAPVAEYFAAPLVVEAAQPAAPAVEADYEPSEASASYRVDPIAPSEFRQSAPVLEAPPEVHAEPPAAQHTFTEISAAGEMHSEPVEVLPAHPAHPAPIEPAAPASPMRHEQAVVSADPESHIAAPSATAFTPGPGQLDEELLDEEESAAPTLQASSIEEMDDSDEETLEGAADLGTMLREMSIDQITRTQPEVDEEDDEDEDDFEEDLLEEEESEDDEEDEEEDANGFQLDEQAPRGDVAEPGDDLHDSAAGREASEFSERDFDQAPSDQEHFAQNGEGRNQRTAEDAPNRDSGREPVRDSERRSGRRDGRDSERHGRRGDRDRSSDRGRGGRPSHGGDHRRRSSAQTTNLPAISDLLKPGQEILVQIAKEPIAKKGARITSHIALPGRFLVFMPTVNHTGVSRKIESDGERRRLKEILLSEKGDASGGFIVRTAAEGATEEELRSDLRFLLNLWADIKARSDGSKSPALIYHDLNLIERILRDQVTDNFSAIWVDTEAEYERVLRFLQRFQPSLIRRVKLYLKETPLFEQFGITEEINKALRSKVWLKSGGSIVINQTEALVAIDINTGKYVGKTARLEDTIVKTNLDAIPEIVRQIRLRDLGGIIIIDFIDMDERKNRNRVMAALEDELKNDRAPSKVLQFNDFGLVAITRKRVKQSLERTLSTPCATCTGTGMVKSPVTVCNDIYVEMRKMHKHLERGDVMLRVHPEVVKQLKSSGAKWLQEMEEMAGKTILVKSDPSLHPEQFDIH